jgi:hypothetical protein
MYTTIPLTPIPENDIEQGLVKEEEVETRCICNWNECSYTAPWCRHMPSIYVGVTVAFCGGLMLALFLGFLHVMNVF